MYERRLTNEVCKGNVLISRRRESSMLWLQRNTHNGGGRYSDIFFGFCSPFVHFTMPNKSPSVFTSLQNEMASFLEES